MKHFTKKGTRVLLVAGALLALGATSAVAGVIVAQNPGATQFAATIEARALPTPTLKACKADPALQRLTGRYAGSFTVAAEPPEPDKRAEVDAPGEATPPEPDKFMLNFSLDALVDRSGVGHAKGKWQLLDESGRTVVGEGELRAVITQAGSPGEATPPEPDRQLRGMLIGAATPPEPDKPALSLLATFSATLSNGALTFRGSVGDPTAVGDAGALLPAVKC